MIILTGLSLATFLLLATSCFARVETNTAEIMPEDVASRYFTFLKDGQCHGGYALTTEAFRTDVTEEFYCNYDFIKMITGSLVSFEVGEAKINDDTTVVPVALKIRVSGVEEPIDIPYDLSLWKENDNWGIHLSGYDYLAYNLGLQPPLAVSEYKDVSIMLKFILINEKENIDSSSFTHVHLDIQNNSADALKWVFPAQGNEVCHLEDLANGQKYFLLNAKGYKTDGNFRYADSEDVKLIFLSPFSESSLILVFKNIPETVEKFDIFLPGFHFSDTGEEWSITFSDLAFIYETVSE